MIAFATYGSFGARALQGLKLVAEPDSLFIEAVSEHSIFDAYNEVLDELAARDELEALVLLHDDAEVVDPALCEKLRARLADPEVAIVGVVGARNVRNLAWWNGECFGRVTEPRGTLDFGGGTHAVEAVDGLFMVLSPWAVRTLRFDAERFTGFYGHDLDICFQAREAGQRVIVDDIAVVHHTKGGYGDEDTFRRADAAWRQKWLGDGAAATPANVPRHVDVPRAAGVRRDDAGETFDWYYAADRAEVRALVPRDARRVLDVGCGAGAVGAALKADLGCEVTGLELMPEAAALARRRLDRVIEADLEDLDALPVPDGYFDTIVFGDVLEHLSDPDRLLRALRRYVATDGAIVCSIPNVGHWSVVFPLLVNDRFTYEDSGLLDRTHQHLFTLTEIAVMLEGAGFRIDTLSRTTHPLPPELAPLADLSAAFGRDVQSAEMRLSSFQYLVLARPVT